MALNIIYRLMTQMSNSGPEFCRAPHLDTQLPIHHLPLDVPVSISSVTRPQPNSRFPSPTRSSGPLPHLSKRCRPVAQANNLPIFLGSFLFFFLFISHIQPIITFWLHFRNLSVIPHVPQLHCYNPNVISTWITSCFFITGLISLLPWSVHHPTEQSKRYF